MSIVLHDGGPPLPYMWVARGWRCVRSSTTAAPLPQAMRPYEGVAVPESEHIEQNAEQLEAAFR